jgi:hypothetical protein
MASSAPADEGMTELASALVSSLPGGDQPTNQHPGKRVLQIVPLDRELLRSIERFGIAKYFQSGRSTQRGSLQGSEGKLLRIERNLLATPALGLHPSSLHPTYAIVDPEGKFGDLLPTSYGDALFEYRIDAIASRTTYTNFDSYNRFVDSHFRWSGAATPLAHDQAMSAPFQRGEELDAYIEAQIWGPLTLGDVKAIYLRGDVLTSLGDQLRRIADQYGVDVYEYAPDDARAVRNGFFVGARVLRIRGRADAPRRTDPASPPLERLRVARTLDTAEHGLLMDRLGLVSNQRRVADELARRLDGAYRAELADTLVWHRRSAWQYAAMLERLPARRAIPRDPKARAAFERYRRFLRGGVRFSKEAIALLESEEAAASDRLIGTADWERLEAGLADRAAANDFSWLMSDTYRAALDRWLQLGDEWSEVRDEAGRRFPGRGDMADRRVRIAAIARALESRSETRRFLNALVRDHRRPRVAAAAFQAAVAGGVATTGTYRAMARLLARRDLAGSIGRELGLDRRELAALRELVERRGPKRRAISALIDRRRSPLAGAQGGRARPAKASPVRRRAAPGHRAPSVGRARQVRRRR